MATTAAHSASFSASQSELPCNLCGSHEVEEVGSKDRDGRPLRTVLCQECGLVFTDPRPTPEETRQFYAKDYRVAYKATYTPKPKHALRETHRALERVRHLHGVAKSGDRLLDVGCGGGFFVYALRSAGIDAQGVEPNHGFAGYAQSELQVPVQNLFLQDVDFPSGSFDVVTLNHVLEHVEDPVGTLTRLSGWLKPEGYLVVEVPNVESRHHAPGNRWHIGHLYNFNPCTLAGIGSKAGLNVYRSTVIPGPDHCHVIFQKPIVAPPHVLVKPHENYERVRKILKQHTPLSHYASPSVYLKLVNKQLAYLNEWQQTRNITSGRQIVDQVIRKAG